MRAKDVTIPSSPPRDSARSTSQPTYQNENPGHQSRHSSGMRKNEPKTVSRSPPAAIGGSRYPPLRRPALALVFIVSIGGSSMTISSVSQEKTVVASGVQPGDRSSDLPDRPVETNTTAAPLVLASLPPRDGSADADAVTEAWKDEYTPAGTDPANTLASITGLDREFGRELASKARQALQDHRDLLLLDSPKEFASPVDITPVIRLASLLGPSSDLAYALVGAASATPANSSFAFTRGHTSQREHFIPEVVPDDVSGSVAARASDPGPSADLAFTLWEPSSENVPTSQSQTHNRPESWRTTTSTTPLLLASYSEVQSSDRKIPHISQSLELASAGAFLTDLNFMPRSNLDLSADSRKLERRIDASLEHIDPLLPTSYQMLDLDLEPAQPSGLTWNKHSIKKGDTIGALWSGSWKLPSSVLYRILADSESARLLNRVYPGQEVAWQTDAHGDLIRLRLWHDSLSGTEWVSSDNGQNLARNDLRKTGEIQHIALTAHVAEDIATSLAARAELSAPAARSLAILLERHLPMHDEKVRPGDRFALLIEQEMIEGDDTPYEVRLLAFDYRGDLIDLTAVRNTDGRFYTPDGKSLLPAFDRRPFTGSYRVSSPYNLRRRHPVTGRTAPHHGTDFAMPIGTPILAPADGKVTHVHTHPHAGRYLVIEHGQGYTTRYLHLQRAFVRTGQTVRRGERIALSGNTGRTTGPHLHYELHVDGVPVDAMRAELPEAKSLAGIHLEQFQNNAQPLLAALRNADPSRQIAMRPFPSQDP